MTNVEQLADAYFERLEGRRLYPHAVSMLWLGWLLAVIAVVLLLPFAFPLFWEDRTAGINWAVAGWLIAEVLLYLTVVVLIEKKKTAKFLLEQGVVNPNRHHKISDHRPKILMDLLQVQPREFGDKAKRVAELMKVRRDLEISEDGKFLRYLRKIYDPDSKARLLAIFLGSLAILTTLFVRTASPDQPSLLDILATPGLLKFVLLLLQIVMLLWLLVMVLQLLGTEVAGSLALWLARLRLHPGRRNLVLKYLVADLLEYDESVAPHSDSAGTPPVVHRRVIRKRPS